MEITNEILKHVIAGKPVGDIAPYKNGSSNMIEAHLKDTVRALERSSRIQVELEQDSYGSGYASYFDVFCYKAGGRSSRIEAGTTITDGITIYLCKLAPIAVFGAMTKTKHKNSASSGFLSATEVNTLPKGDWADVMAEIRMKLEEKNFVLLEPKVLKKEIPFDARIETNLGDPPFKIFDAFFHWMD